MHFVLNHRRMYRFYLIECFFWTNLLTTFTHLVDNRNLWDNMKVPISSIISLIFDLFKCKVYSFVFEWVFDYTRSELLICSCLKWILLLEVCILDLRLQRNDGINLFIFVSYCQNLLLHRFVLLTTFDKTTYVFP